MLMMQRPRQRHSSSCRWVLGALAAASCAPQVAFATTSSHVVDVEAQQLALVDETQASRAAAAAALAHRIDAVAKQIDEQLELDGAPLDVRNEESSLFHSAQQAMRRSALRTHHNRRGMHHLRQGESRHHRQQEEAARHQSSRRLEHKHDLAKVSEDGIKEGALAHEVKEAEKLVEDQLERRHAPQRIREQEKELLEGAAKMAEKLRVTEVEDSDAGDAKKDAAPNSTAKSASSSEVGLHGTSGKVNAGSTNSSGSVSVAELRKEHELLEKRNAALRSENTKLRQQATQEESKLVEQNSDLEKENAKLEKDNARLQGELGEST